MLSRQEARARNVMALLINFAIVFFTGAAIWYNFRPDVSKIGWFGFAGWNSLRFFTNLSNIFVAIAAAVTVVEAAKNVVLERFEFPKWLIVFKFAATTSVSVTMGTVLLFLAPFSPNGFLWFFTQNNFYLHFYTPSLAIITFIYFERTAAGLNKRDCFWGVLPTVAYSAVYIPMVILGEANGGWPDFYGFTFGGNLWAASIAALCMYAFSLLLAFLLYGLQKWLLKRFPLYAAGENAQDSKKRTKAN